MHIILKGVSTPEDAILAYEAGCQGIVLSNHGGRQLDTSRSGLENLIDIVAALKTKGPWPNPNFSIFVDGGVRRASDVLKAIALGASAVGVGRGFLYAFSSYGQEGVERAIEILRDEFEMNMRLIGARSINELVPEMVDASALHAHAGITPADNLYNTTCKFCSTRLESVANGLEYRPTSWPRFVQKCEALNYCWAYFAVVFVALYTFSLTATQSHLFNFSRRIAVMYIPKT